MIIKRKATVTGPRPAHRPAASPAAASVAVVIAVALLGFSMVAGREFLIDRQVIGGTRLLARACVRIGHLHWQQWMAPASGFFLAAGVLLLALAVKPRARTHFRTAGEPALWLRATDVARACTAAAHRVNGVVQARTVVAKRSAQVRIVARSADLAHVADAARAEVDSVLREMEVPRRVRISVERAMS